MAPAPKSHFFDKISVAGVHNLKEILFHLWNDTLVFFVLCSLFSGLFRFVCSCASQAPLLSFAAALWLCWLRLRRSEASGDSPSRLLSEVTDTQQLFRIKAPCEDLPPTCKSVDYSRWESICILMILKSGFNNILNFNLLTSIKSVWKIYLKKIINFCRKTLSIKILRIQCCDLLIRGYTFRGNWPFFSQPLRITLDEGWNCVQLPSPPGSQSV